MAIPVYLQKYKAAGIYRVVFDKSIISNIDADTLRLVVGYSEKGPFNTPVFISSATEFISTFGKASRKLEKRGVFFHRMALQALANGPILALNLKCFENEVVGAIGFNPNSLCSHAEHEGKTANLLDARNKAQTAYHAAYVDYVQSVEEDPSKATTTSSELIEAKEAYEAAQIAYINGLFDLHKDSGNFTATPQYLALEDIYDTTRFWKLDDTQLADVYTANLVSDSKIGAVPTAQVDDTTKEPKRTNNKLSGYIRIVSTDAASTSNTLVFRKTVDTAALKTYDITIRDWYANEQGGVPEYLVGYEDRKINEFMVDVYVFRGKFTESVTDPSSLGNYIVTAPSPYVPYEKFSDLIRFMPYVTNAFGDKLDTLDQLYFDERSNAVAKYTGFTLPFFVDKQGVQQSLNLMFNADNNIHNMMMYFDTTALEDGDITADELVAPKSKLSEEDAEKMINKIKEVRKQKYNLNLIKTDAELKAAKKNYDEADLTLASTFTEKTTAYNEAKAALTARSAEYEAAVTAWENAEEGEAKTTAETAMNEAETAMNEAETAKATAEANLRNAEVAVDAINTYYTALVNATIIEDKATSLEAKIAAIDKISENVTTDGPLGVDYATTYLLGYTYAHPLPTKQDVSDVNNNNDHTDLIPASDDHSCYRWINDYILNALLKYRGLRIGLCTKAEVDYRYIVDTFKSYVSTSCKAILAGLAKEKQNAFALLNFPAIETFKKHTSKKFIDNKTRQFTVSKIVDPNNGFSLPSEAEGASFCAFFTPMKMNDSGVTSIVPSAALVSNNFMDKYGTRKPYYIVAGQNYGLLMYSGLIGPDYNWSQDELQIIEPYGVNCLIYRPNVGTFINANQTAKQTPKSGLSLINVRELVIYLQDEIEKVLQYFHWEINSAETRSRILDRVNAICENVKNNGGLYDYLNVMDETNNTEEIIDNEMAVLSTHIEPTKGCGKMVQSLTIHRTGGMSASLSE